MLKLFREKNNVNHYRKITDTFTVLWVEELRRNPTIILKIFTKAAVKHKSFCWHVTVTSQIQMIAHAICKRHWQLFTY